MSSTRSTSRPSRSWSRSLRIRTTPGGLRRGPVGRHRHEVQLDREPDVAREVGHHDEGALQHADQQQVASLVVLGDLIPELADHLLDLRLRDEHRSMFRSSTATDGGERRSRSARTGAPGLHLAPLHPRLSGEVQRPTYSRCRSAFNPWERSRRRPSRPAARSSTASISSRAASALQRRSASRTTREPTALGSERGASPAGPRRPVFPPPRRRTPRALGASSSASARSSAAVWASGSRTGRRSARSSAGIPRSRSALRRNRGSAFVGSTRGRRCSARQQLSTSARVTSSSGRTKGPDLGFMPLTASGPRPVSTASRTVSA